MKKTIGIIVILVSLVGGIYYSFKIITWKKHVEENSAIQTKIEEEIVIINPSEDEETKYEIDFGKLKEMNNDTVAYLKVNNTDINYAVVQSKNNDYYLKHNFDKKWNTAGWIFADYRVKFDGNDKNIVIYGHSMKDNSMFGTLKNILNDSKSDHEIMLATKDETYYYEVFSSYSINPEEYYLKTNFKDNEFETFINKIKSRSKYNYDVEVNSNDKILTLSTCTSNGKNRVVIHAKLITQ